MTGETFTQTQTWAMALDPAKWGITSPTKEEFQKQASTVSLNGYYPDITNPKVQELMLSWAERQIDSGMDGVWIDLLYNHAKRLQAITKDVNHPAVKESYDAASKLVDDIHAYGKSKGKQVYVGSWVTSMLFPYAPPNFDFATATMVAQELMDKKYDVAKWDNIASKVKEKFGDIPIFVFVDWGGSDSPLVPFSQQLSQADAQAFLGISDDFFTPRGMKFIYPVHGGSMVVQQTSNTTLAYGQYNWYDSNAPEFQTYDTIKELAQKKASIAVPTPTATQTPTRTPTPSCTDTDGGVNFNIKGTCTGDDGVPHTDYCISGYPFAYEYACNAMNRCYMDTTTCPAGCSDGACVTATPTTPTATPTPSQSTCGNTHTGVWPQTCSSVCSSAGKTCVKMSSCDGSCLVSGPCANVCGGAGTVLGCECAVLPTPTLIPTPTATPTPTPAPCTISACQAQYVTGNSACAAIGGTCISSNCGGGCTDWPAAPGTCGCTAQCLLSNSSCTTPTATPTPTLTPTPTPAPTAYCGDGSCNGGETSSSCCADCGPPPQTFNSCCTRTHFCTSTTTYAYTDSPTNSRCAPWEYCRSDCVCVSNACSSYSTQTTCTTSPICIWCSYESKCKTAGDSCAAPPTSTPTPTPAPLVNHATPQFLLGVPATMCTKETKYVSAGMKNDGTTTWTSSYSLAPTTVFKWLVAGVPLGGTIAPGYQKAFTFKITAPPVAGTYPFQWKMKDSSSNFFESPNPAASPAYISVAACASTPTPTTTPAACGDTNTGVWPSDCNAVCSSAGKTCTGMSSCDLPNGGVCVSLIFDKISVNSHGIRSFAVL